MAPSDYDAALTWIPCTDGQLGCDEPKLKGESLGPPTAIREGASTPGVLLGGVVYDFASDKARFVLSGGGLNPNATRPDGLGYDLALSRCRTSLAAASSGVWVVIGTDTDDRQLMWFPYGQTKPTQTLSLPKLEPDEKMFASDELFLLGRADGQLILAKRGQPSLTMTYGPGRRLWPRGVFGAVVFLTSAPPRDPHATDYVEEDGFAYDGTNFTDLGVKGAPLHADGESIVWFVRNQNSNVPFDYHLWMAPFSGEAGVVQLGTRQVGGVKFADSIIRPSFGLQTGPGRLALARGDYLQAELATMNVATGGFSTRSLLAPGNDRFEMRILTDTHAWFIPAGPSVQGSIRRFTTTVP